MRPRPRILLPSALVAAAACSTPPPVPELPRETRTAAAADRPDETPASAGMPAPDWRASLARGYAAEAQRLMDHGQVERSLEMLRAAEKMAPEDAGIERSARELRALLGVRDPHPRSPIARAAARARIRRQMLREMLREMLRIEMEASEKALAAGDAEGSQRHAQRARTLLRLHPELD